VRTDQEMDGICGILRNTRSIAVVGMSDKPDRISRQIAEFLSDEGYEVVGVNPNCRNGGYIPVYPDLDSIPFEIDLVNVFRRSETIHEIIPAVLRKNPKTLWLQEGIINDEAVRPAVERGIKVIQDKCIAVCLRKCRQSAR